MQGVIKKIVDGKPFGFITIEGQAADMFFHQEGVVGVSFAELKPGDTVTFEVEETEQNGEKRTKAINVQRVAA